MLELRQVFQTEDYQSAFDLATPGFKEHWWAGNLKRLADVRADTFIFLEGGEEVARARVDPEYLLQGHYTGLRTPRRVVDVDRLEVRADLRYRPSQPGRTRKIGRRAAALLIDRYSDRDLTAFSEQADGFWRSIGWTHFRRVDESRVDRPLFVHLNH